MGNSWEKLENFSLAFWHWLQNDAFLGRRARWKVWQGINRTLYAIMSMFPRTSHSTLLLNFSGKLLRKGDFLFIWELKEFTHLLEIRLFHWHVMTFKIMESVLICNSNFDSFCGVGCWGPNLTSKFELLLNVTDDVVKVFWLWSNLFLKNRPT